MRKSWFVCLLVCFLVIPGALPGTTLKMISPDGSLQGEFPGISNGDALMANLTEFFESLGFEISWSSALQRLEVSRDDEKFRFRAESEYVRTPENRLSLSTSPVRKSGELYLDVQSLVRLVQKHSEEEMIWNEARQQVQLQAPGDSWEGPGTDSGESGDPIGQFIDESESESSDDGTLVMVDPGHGGRDPGAIGPDGLQEKDIVLDLSLALRDVLRNDYPNLNVELTRDSDEFLPLQKRTQIANQRDADVFVSIHANAGRSSVAKGFEVFTLQSDATDASAEELAEIENSALRYEGVPADELNDISFILWQLRSTIHTRESRNVATDILDSMEKHVSGENRGMHGAPFWVLKDARMPAVLVESGFLSNPEEARRLSNETHQQDLARAIAEGVNNYIAERTDS